MKEIKENELFGISSNLFPCVCVGMYWTCLSPSDREEELQHYCEQFEYVSIDMNEYKEQIVLKAADFIAENVCPIMKKYGLENILVEGIHSPREYNFTDDCLHFTVEMSSDWRSKMHDYLNDFRKDSKFQKYIEEHWYSRDGFWSWMPQSFDEIEQMDDEERCVGAYLTLCLLNEEKLGLQGESLEYINDELYLEEDYYTHYYNIMDEYLGETSGKEMEELYNNDYRMNELYHNLLSKIGDQWKNFDRIEGKHGDWYCVSADNDAMRLIFWACENGYTVSDLEAMAA